MKACLTYLCLSLSLIPLAALAQDSVKPSPPTGEKISLKMALKKGEARKLVMTTEVVVDVTSGGEALTMTTGMLMEMGFKVFEVDANGNQNMEVKIDRMKMDIEGTPMAVNFDSASPDAANTPVGQEVMPMIGKAYTQLMSPYGETLEVGGLENMPPSMRQELENSANSMQMMATYPKKPVDNGDTWTAKITQSQGTPQEMTVDATYTLLNRKDSVANVAVDAELSGFMSGKMTGLMELELETGWLKLGTMNMDASSNQGGTDMDMSATMKFEGSKKE